MVRAICEMKIVPKNLKTSFSFVRKATLHNQPWQETGQVNQIKRGDIGLQENRQQRPSEKKRGPKQWKALEGVTQMHVKGVVLSSSRIVLQTAYAPKKNAHLCDQKLTGMLCVTLDKPTKNSNLCNFLMRPTTVLTLMRVVRKKKKSKWLTFAATTLGTQRATATFMRQPYPLHMYLSRSK